MNTDKEKKEYMKNLLEKVNDYSNEEEALLVGVATGLSLAKINSKDAA